MPANGAMLRLARQLKGFHQTEAAVKLGIEQSLLSRVENGLVEAREEMLLRAENVYEQPRSFFELTDPVYGAPVSVHPMWRRKADVSVSEMDAIIAEANVRVMHLRRLLEGAEYKHANDIPRLDIDDYDDPETIAGLVRAHWKVPKGPLMDLTLLVERAGVLVAHSAFGGASVSGVTFSARGLPPLIVLNDEQPADRLRFTLAHELGHLVMHRFPSPTMEEEAHTFASALLMPAADIRPYLIGRRIDLERLAALKPEWKVAMQALLMRATALGLVTKHQAQYLWKQINARRLRLREPPELDFDPERPTVISSMLRLHMDALGYSIEELAQMLHVRVSTLNGLYGVAPKEQRPKFTILK
jgi:Zn-dependent peptidase ImmA (M78 family)